MGTVVAIYVIVAVYLRAITKAILIGYSFIII